MKNQQTITHAFCIELAREVTITEARRAYMSLPAGTARFHFFCADPACVDSKGQRVVKVIGTNYTTAAEESEKFIASHFRRHGLHNPNCSWEIERETIDNLSNQNGRPRLARVKMTELVEVFDPRIETEYATPAKQEDPYIDSLQLSRSHLPGQIKTSDLERLVESYLEARHLWGFERLKDLPLHIVKGSDVTYGSYFRHIKYGGHEGVVYGGAYLVETRSGVKLRFFDKFQDQQIHLYLSERRLAEYRFGGHIRKILSMLSDGLRKYVTVYAIGHLAHYEPTNSYDLVIKSLSHLVFMLPENRSPATALCFSTNGNPTSS